MTNDWTLNTSVGGTVKVSDALHTLLLESNATGSVYDLIDPSSAEKPNAQIQDMYKSLVEFLSKDLGISSDRDFSKELDSIVEAKCNDKPSHFAEYIKASELSGCATQELGSSSAWGVLLVATHPTADDIEVNVLINRSRVHVYFELIDFVVTLGGGYKSVGTMENYRAFRGGIYTDRDSYRQYIPVN